MKKSIVLSALMALPVVFAQAPGGIPEFGSITIIAIIALAVGIGVGYMISKKKK